MVTLTSRSASGTPDSAVSLRIFALTARADPRSAIARGCITSSTTPETWKYCHADIITAYAQYAAPTATNPQKKRLIGASPSRVGPPVLHPRRERVLEPVRLLVRVRPVEPERVRQPALEQAVTARHDLGDLPPLRRERELLAVADLDVAAARHPVHRLGHRRRGDRHVLGEAGADDGLAAAAEVVDGGQIVLGGGGGGRHARAARRRGLGHHPHYNRSAMLRPHDAG